MATILIVYHSQSGNTEAAAQAVAEGVAAVSGAEAVVKKAADATAADLVACDAVVLGTPDYFSYMAGGLKEFLDRVYYPTQGKVADKPCGIFVTHGGGGKAVESVRAICRSFKFRLAGEPLLVLNRPDEAARAQLHEMGKQVAQLAG